MQFGLQKLFTLLSFLKAVMFVKIGKTKKRRITYALKLFPFTLSDAVAFYYVTDPLVTCFGFTEC